MPEDLLSHPVSYPMHESAGSGGRNGPFNGAYQLENWIPNDSIDLGKNPCYWDAGQTKTERVSYFPIEDPGSELSRYDISGEMTERWRLAVGEINESVGLARTTGGLVWDGEAFWLLHYGPRVNTPNGVMLSRFTIPEDAQK